MPGISITYIILYFLFPIIFISLSFYFIRRGELSLNKFFFAAGNIPWWVISLSLLTLAFYNPLIFSLIQFDTFTLAVIYGVLSAAIILLNKKLFPLFYKMELNTFPEFFEKRFNRNCRLLVSAICIISNIFIRLFVVIIITNILINSVSDIDSYSFILFFLVVASLSILISGILGEAYSSLIQVLFIIVSSILFFFQPLNLNSAEGVFNSPYQFSVENNESFFIIIPLFLILNFWFWSSDQTFFTRIISSERKNQSKKVLNFLAVLQVLPVTGIIISESIFNNTYSGIEKSIIFSADFSSSFITKGLIIAVIAAAFIAAVSNIISSSVHLFIFDFYGKSSKNISDRKVILVARLSILALLFLSILMLSFSQTAAFNSSIKSFEIFIYFISLILVVFAVGIFNKKINSVSAFLTLICGAIIILYKALSDISGSGFLTAWPFQQFILLVFLLPVILLFLFQKINVVQRIVLATKRKLNTYYVKNKGIRGYNKIIF